MNLQITKKTIKLYKWMEILMILIKYLIDKLMKKNQLLIFKNLLKMKLKT